MASNNNNNNNKTGGSSNINKEIEIAERVNNISNMASCSIIKTTQYWLPDELWDIVKDYMGLCKKDEKVNWELVKKANLNNVLKMKLPKPTFELNILKPKVIIDRNGGVVLRHSKGIKKGGTICPKQIYFKKLKKKIYEETANDP